MDSTASVKEEPKTESRPDNRPQLKVVVTRGSIADVKAPVAVVGSYTGIAPAGALKALDNEVDGWIARAVDRGMVGGDLGQLFFVPVMNKEIRARSILLAGMGEYGRFSYEALCYLAMNVCLAIAELKVDSFATVLIGSGEGNLDLPKAAKGLLSGFCDAIHRLPGEQRITEFMLVEVDKDRHKEIVKILNGVKTQIPNIAIEIVEGKVTGRRRDKPAPPIVSSRQSTVPTFVNRITIERGGDGYTFSALTHTAVIPVRAVNVQKFFSEGIATELRDGEGTQSHEKFGRLLHNYIFPRDFERLIDDGKPLTLILDKDTAALPWEMACFGLRSPRKYFGPHLKLTRQFRTVLSSIPGIAPPVNKSLRVLIIADPSKDFPLEYARKEGNLVKKVFDDHKELLKDEIEIIVEARITPDECKPVRILELLLNETWDIVHYSGHGIYDPDRPDQSGWVFGPDVTLTPTEIFRLRQVPRLVFANACFSAAVNSESKPPAEETTRKLAGMAEAFFERGVQNYIGTGWPVVDDTALTFAQVFYEQALKGELLGEALAQARFKVFDWGSTWGAYQHYGQSNVRVV